MKILLVGNYPPPYGGIAVHVQLLHRMLLREGIDCKVINLDPQAQVSDSYSTVNGPATFLLKVLLEGRGRVVHLHTNGHNRKSWMIATVISWVGRLLRRPSLLTIHSGMAPDYIEKSSYLNKLLIKLALIHQSSIVCVNEQIVHTLSKGDYQFSNTVLMPAFLFDEKELSELNETQQQQLSQYQPLLSTVAFFRPEYGIELLIEALASLKEQFPKIGCVVMGSGEGKDRLQQMAQEYGVADHLLWYGDLEHDKCLSVIKSSQLFVRPTLADGDSISVREAIQLGVPVVASDTGHRPESVILFKPGNAQELAEQCALALNKNLVAKKELTKKNSNSLETGATSGQLSNLSKLYQQITQQNS